MTMNMLFSLGYVILPIEVNEKVAAGPLQFVEESPMSFEDYIKYFVEEFGQPTRSDNP